MQKRMDLKSQDLSLILVLIKFKTLTAAAKELGLGQSTLSRQLEALEEKLGLPLFSRHRSGLVPTANTLDLKAFACQIESITNQANNNLHNFVERPDFREVHISCPDAIAEKIVSARISDLLSANPGLSVKVTATEKLLDLSGLDCDIVLRLGVKPTGDCTVQKLMSSPLRFFGLPKFLPAGGGGDLNHLPILVHDTKHGAASKLNKIIPVKSIVFKSNRLSACLEAAFSGAGLILLPSYFGSSIPEFVEIPVRNFPNIETSLYMSSSRALRKVKSVAVTWKWLHGLFK